MERCSKINKRGGPNKGVEGGKSSKRKASLFIRQVRVGSGGPGGHGVTLRAFLSLLRHMEQLLLVTSCDSPAGIGASLRTDRRTEGQTDVEVEIVI